jgi:bifunctional non-homologous end joining protein LigD
MECATVALELRALLDQLGLESAAKTSGSKGIQVYLPLNTPAAYEQTKAFAQALAQLLEERHPKLVVSRMRKDLRGGKVFVDWNQNEDFKTTVCAYSLRARERPTVSTPVAWDELEAALEAEEPDRLVFEAGEVLERVERDGDRFAPAAELEQELPRL